MVCQLFVTYLTGYSLLLLKKNVRIESSFIENQRDTTTVIDAV